MTENYPLIVEKEVEKSYSGRYPARRMALQAQR